MVFPYPSAIVPFPSSLSCLAMSTPTKSPGSEGREDGEKAVRACKTVLRSRGLACRRAEVMKGRAWHVGRGRGSVNMEGSKEIYKEAHCLCRRKREGQGRGVREWRARFTHTFNFVDLAERSLVTMTSERS